jgi:YbgC/YbaW family acyl-CoA thioester hydrolase
VSGGPFRFRSAQALRWVDVDAAGVVNHAVWFTLAEQARFAYFRQLGLVDGDVPPFLLGSTSARYERPGRFGMEIEVLARTTRLGGKSLDMEYEVRLGSTGERLVAIAATLVWVDAQLESCEIPVEARRAIAAFEGIPERGAAPLR